MRGSYKGLNRKIAKGRPRMLSPAAEGPDSSSSELEPFFLKLRPNLIPTWKGNSSHVSNDSFSLCLRILAFYLPVPISTKEKERERKKESSECTHHSNIVF